MSLTSFEFLWIRIGELYRVICDYSDDHLYVFHDELIADESHIVLDEDDQEGVLRLGPTESPEIQRMRVELNNLNYAQVGLFFQLDNRN